MPDTITRTTTPAAGKQTAVTLRALEHQVDGLTELPLNELPQSARTILRSVANLLVAARWLIEDAVHAKDAP